MPNDSKDRYYIDAEQLRRHIIRHNDTGETSDELGMMILRLCEKILQHSKFRGYPDVVKDDMRSLACYHIVKGLKNINPDRTGRQVFNYLTTAVFNSYVQAIKKYYRHLEIRKTIQDAVYREMEVKYGAKRFVPDSSYELDDGYKY